MKKTSISEIEVITKNINDIIYTKIFKLPYFKKENFNKNVVTFKRQLIEDYENYYPDLPPAFYHSKTNSLYVATVVFNPSLLLHEMIHMLSANTDTQIIGYANSQENYYFNEAATQYLTSKYFGNENDSNGYEEITSIFAQLVYKYGENNMYNGFFEANFDKFFNNFKEEDKNIIQNTIYEMNHIMKQKEEQLKTTNISK